MRSLLVLALLAGTAHADEVGGLVLTASGTSVASSPVRVVGDHFVVLARTDAGGRFLVRDLPPGEYRIVLDRPDLHTVPIRSLTIDPEPHMCVLPPLSSRRWDSVIGYPPPPMRTFSMPLGARGHIDTTSTSLRTVLKSPQRVGR